MNEVEELKKKPKLFQIKGKKNCRVFETCCNIESLNIGDSNSFF